LDRRVYEKFIVMGHHRPPPFPVSQIFSRTLLI
jgi:hypothetical protein